MANYPTIMRQRPEMREFIRYRRWIHRGDVMAYKGNISCDAFSTDQAGFRHSTFRGESFSFGDCLRSERYGVVLGASNIFGFGVAGNENTIPSLLGERFGFPFANLTMPGGNSRNLHSLLVALLARAARPPEIVVHFSGGDYSTFCSASMGDPIFGSPNRKQIATVVRELGGVPNPDKQLGGLLAFTSLWMTAIASACRAHDIALVIGNDTTFFEKDKPTAAERDAELGKPFSPKEERQFANHRKFGGDFLARRKLVAEKLDLPLAGWGLNNDVSFVDEFHCDPDGTRVLSNAVAEAVEPLLVEREPA